jgi:IS5 family transposase
MTAQVLGELLHGQETLVWGDSAYTGQKQVIRKAAPKGRDFTNRKGCCNPALTEAERTKNCTKSQVRAKVEHPFLVIKRIFGFTKVCCRGG